MCVTESLGYQIDPCNLGGPGKGSKLRVLLKTWLDAFPDLQDYLADTVANKPATLDGDITLDTITYVGAEWKEWEVTHDKGRFNSKFEGPQGSGSVSSTLTSFIPGSDPLAVFLMQQHQNVEMLVSWQNAAGKTRIMGDDTRGCYLTWEEDSGEKDGDEVGINVTFTWTNHPRPCPFYDGVFS